MGSIQALTLRECSRSVDRFIPPNLAALSNSSSHSATPPPLAPTASLEILLIDTPNCQPKGASRFLAFKMAASVKNPAQQVRARNFISHIDSTKAFQPRLGARVSRQARRISPRIKRFTLPRQTDHWSLDLFHLIYCRVARRFPRWQVRIGPAAAAFRSRRRGTLNQDWIVQSVWLCDAGGIQPDHVCGLMVSLKCSALLFG